MKTAIEQLFESLHQQGYELPLIPKGHYLTMEREQKEEYASQQAAELRKQHEELDKKYKEALDFIANLGLEFGEFKATVKSMRNQTEILRRTSITEMDYAEATLKAIRILESEVDNYLQE